MFDIISLKQDIFEYYFKHFNVNHNKKLVKNFTREWICLVEMYSKMPHFIRFNTEIPILKNLNTNSKSLIITLFHNDERFSNTSVFPICLFVAYFKHNALSCKESMNLLLLYITIAKIKYVAFYKMQNYKKVLYNIKEHKPSIKCYPPSSFRYFCKLNKIYKY